jgi:hypothetical protein
MDLMRTSPGLEEKAMPDGFLEMIGSLALLASVIAHVGIAASGRGQSLLDF